MGRQAGRGRNRQTKRQAQAGSSRLKQAQVIHTQMASSSSAQSFLKVSSRSLLDGDLSARKLHQLVVAAEDAGARGADRLTKAGKRGKHQQNLHRDMMRSVMKQSAWRPGVYQGQLTTMAKDKTIAKGRWPFILPHEVLSQIMEENPVWLKEVQPNSSSGYGFVAASTQDIATEFKLDVSQCVPLGLHADGVPYTAKMRDNLYCVSWNFAGCSSSSRFLITCVPGSAMVKEKTFDDIWKLVAWSFRCMMQGTWPSRKDDGSPFGTSRADALRHQKSGSPLRPHGCFVQLRGDWEFFRDGVRLPAWNKSDYMCWRCQANGQTKRDLSPEGPCLSQPLSGFQFLERELRSGRQLSAFWGIPGARVGHVRIDWMHTIDLGVSALVLGNVMSEYLDVVPGNNQAERLAEVWRRVRLYYSENHVENRIQKLTLGMFRPRGEGYIFSGKAKETANLVPWASKVATELAGPPGEHWHSVMCMLECLQTLYGQLQEDPYPTDQAKSVCERFLLLYSGLMSEAERAGKQHAWMYRPKLHLMQELLVKCVQEWGNPKQYWCYRDEDALRWLSKAGVRRGGAATAYGIADVVINNLLAATSVSVVIN